MTARTEKPWSAGGASGDGIAPALPAAAIALLCVLVLSALLGPAVAQAGALAGPRGHRRAVGPDAVSLVRSSTHPYYACPRGACEAIVDPRPARSAHTGGRFALPSGTRLLEGGGELGGYDPSDLQSAYQIPTAGGSGQTVAVVDAYAYPAAESDLAKYRSRYGLPACTKGDGCFRKLNEKGEEGKYPTTAEVGWEAESALDLDMVSAACPSCHLMLVEASTELPADTGTAVDTAARLGATEISNSYGYPEDYEPWCGSSDCLEYASDYEHPGTEVVASAGDAGYDNYFYGLSAPDFPASSPDVIAVGGTSLHKASTGRGWSESVWQEEGREIGTGSGCSLVEAKPAWQADTGCSKRTDDDISADAACETPVSVYTTPYGGWEDLCGTSASSPLVAGILAHASESVRAQGADAFYLHPGALFDVTTGANGTCAPPAEDEYLCHAEVGFDGPTGLGTPDELPQVVRPSVTGLDPSSGPAQGGVSVTVTGTGFTGADAVYFGAAKASAFTIDSAGTITAVAPAGSGVVDVTVASSAGTSEAVPADHFTYLVGPEFGRCLKVATGTGHYSTGVCTGSGTRDNYEWFPAFGADPIAHRAFTLTYKAPSAPKLETTAKEAIVCTAETGSGEYTGDRTVGGVTLTFSGCHLGASEACTSSGSAEGTILTHALAGALGVIAASSEGAVKDKVGLDLGPAVGEVLASPECGSDAVSIRGSVIGEATRNVMTASDAIHYLQAKGVQRIGRFEGGAEDVLQAMVGAGGYAGAGLSLTAVIGSGEKIEINTVL